MKLATSKFWRKYQSEITIDKQIKKLKWNQSEVEERLNKRKSEIRKDLNELAKDVTYEEFENELSSNMCCEWEDFKDAYEIK